MALEQAPGGVEWDERPVQHIGTLVRDGPGEVDHPAIAGDLVEVELHHDRVPVAREGLVGVYELEAVRLGETQDDLHRVVHERLVKAAVTAAHVDKRRRRRSAPSPSAPVMER